MALSPESGQFLLDKMLSGEMAVTANVKEEKKPDYLKPIEGSPSHPGMAMIADMPQGDMGGV